MNYAYFKLIHLIAVMLFLGNIITGIFWMRFAVNSKEASIISHTMNSIIKLDKYFTIPAVIIITAFGILGAYYSSLSILKTGWILWSIILFSISGMLFSIKVAPLQKTIYLMSSNSAIATKEGWMNFKKQYLKWDTWGIISTLASLAAFVMMVLKVPA